MKINPSAYNVGKTGAVRPTDSDIAAKGAADVAAAQKTEQNKDQILISPKGAMKADVEHLTKAIVSEIEKPASSERLEALRTAVQEGSYHVETDELVNSLMQRWMGL